MTDVTKRTPAHKWAVGEEVAITGDRKSWDHDLAPGTICTITGYFMWKKDLGYEVQVNDRSWGFNVAQADLQSSVPEVTEEEMQAVLKSLGVKK